MPTYLLATKETEDLLASVIEQYHPRLLNEDVKIGILMAYASVNEKTGEKTGHAIKGYAGAAAGASVKKVAAKDRLTKKYDVELLIDGDHWPDMPEPQRIAMLDHEMTHIETTGKVDDNMRPLVKMRDEDFIVWGFLEVAQRHGMAAVECRSLKALMDNHGNLLLGLEGDKEDAARPAKKRNDTSTVTISMPGTDMEPVTLTGEQFSQAAKRIGKKLAGEDLSPTGQQINEHRKRTSKTPPANAGPDDMKEINFPPIEGKSKKLGNEPKSDDLPPF